MGYKKLTFYRQARYHATFRQNRRNTAPISSPPKNQCLQMYFKRGIISSTATAKHNRTPQPSRESSSTRVKGRRAVADVIVLIGPIKVSMTLAGVV